jgi:hypothetical protein
MIQNHQFCNKCILPKGFLGVELNTQGLCNFCADPNYKTINWARTEISKKRKEEALSDWNAVVEDMLGHKSKDYDCVLGYSGGKDSTALLDHLVNELNTRVLAITINTGFMTDIAKENIKTTLKTIRVDHLLIEDAIPTFTILYRYHFLNHASSEIFLARNICDYCSDLIHSIVVKVAMKRDVPYVLFGYSPDQIFRYFFEIPEEEIRHSWRPRFLESEPFSKSDARWYLTEQEVNMPNLPRVILPYHVISYCEQDIINLVESKDYIKRGHADPLLTNCNVVHAATFYDFNRYGGILYAFQYAELARQDPESRKKWLRTLKMSAPLILENRFKPKEVNRFFKQIGVSQEEILNLIETQLKNDPNNAKIKEIRALFAKRRK